jgi:hypothetical protein
MGGERGGQGEDPDYGNARANLDKARRNLAARTKHAA